MLGALLERPGAILSRAQLEQRLYGNWGEEVESNAVEVRIHNLQKLGTDFIRQCARGWVTPCPRPLPRGPG